MLMSSSRFVITGGTKGLGRALSRELVSQGNTVLMTSRKKERAQIAARQIKDEAKYLPNYQKGGKIFGTGCIVSDNTSVANLRKTAQLLMGGADAWICNAAQSGNYSLFLDQNPQTIGDVVSTNLKGTILCAQEAMKMFKTQKEGGSIFFVDGAGCDGIATPGYAVYGSTKAGIQQFWNSIKQETNEIDVRAHMISPGMVLTPLLLEGTNTESLGRAFNILCEHPEVPAAFLANRIQDALTLNHHTSISYLSLPRITWKFLTYPLNRNRHFDEYTGLKLYSDDFQMRVKYQTRDIIRERQSKQREMIYIYIAGSVIVYNLFFNLH